MEKVLILVLVAGFGLARAWVSKSNWNESYVKITTCKKCKNYEGKYDVSDVSFRLYNTKFYQPKKDIWEEIEYNERHDKVSLAEGTMFDQSSKTLVVAHGNSQNSPAGQSGGNFGKKFWIHYAQAANETGEHYNIISISWGSGWTKYHAFTGIKAARVLEYLQQNHGLDVDQVHAMGWRNKNHYSYGADVVNAMASEVVFSGMGKIGRLTLLDAGNRQEEYKIKGNPVKQIGFFNRTFAGFVDVYHSSKTGVYDRPIGHADIWINGGLTQPEGIEGSAHGAAMDFFLKSILNPNGDCQYRAVRCQDHRYVTLYDQDTEWMPFLYKDRNKQKTDTCEYGTSEADESTLVGQYISPDSAYGDYLIFITKSYQLCEDINCDKVC